MKILIIGGNRFFGKKLTSRLLNKGHDVTLLNRGNIDDGFSKKINRIRCDRTDQSALTSALGETSWDLVYDQVCFDYQAAQAASEVFANKTQRYIFTSSQSVYEPGPDLKEEDFRPENHSFQVEETMFSNYAEAKRQAEVGFWKNAKFPMTFVRFPIVIGHDDYTNRFRFHLERIKEGKPIYFPNLEAKISFITSDFAAETLAAFAGKELDGAVNAASPAPISLARFINVIEKSIGKKAVLASQPSEENHSPYGIENDWFMNCSKLKEYGLVSSEIEDWLPRLLG